jgi:hypothetical protein
MEIKGVVKNGVIVPQDGCPLPEGARVTIVPAASESRTGMWDDLLELAEEVERQPCDLPEDLSANHDHYLAGAPKRS